MGLKYELKTKRQYYKFIKQPEKLSCKALHDLIYHEAQAVLIGIKKRKKKKKPTFLWLDYRFTQFMKLFWDMNKVLQTTATGDICVIDVSATDDIQDLIREIISKVCV